MYTHTNIYINIYMYTNSCIYHSYIDHGLIHMFTCIFVRIYTYTKDVHFKISTYMSTYMSTCICTASVSLSLSASNCLC